MYVGTKITTLLPRAHAQKGKAMVLYVCRHENHHFRKLRDLSDLLASLFSQSAQKLPLVLFKSFGKAHARQEQHLLLLHCTLFKAQVFLHRHVSSSAIDLRRHSLIIREQQEVEIESLTTQLCVSSVPRRLYARENQCRHQQVIAQRQRCNFFSKRSQK